MQLNFQELQFDAYNQPESPTLVLKTMGDSVIGTLGLYFNLKLNLRYNDVSEISFDLPAFNHDEKTPFYEQVTGFKVIEIAPFGKFILTNPQASGDGVREIKSCKGYSLEYELNHKNIYIPSGTYNFYSPRNRKDTLLGMIMDLIPNWQIGEIDTKLLGKYRTFESSDNNLYAFMMNTLQQAYHCLFLFDTQDRIVHVKSADSIVTDSPIFLSYDNLIKNVSVTELSDTLVTSLQAFGADPVTIRTVNPMGTNKLYNLDYLISNGDIPKNIATKWASWKQAFLVNQPIYGNLITTYGIALSGMLSENAKLTLLKNELFVLEQKQSAKIEGISYGTATQKDLDDTNQEIAAKKVAIGAQESAVKVANGVLENLTAQKKEINQRCGFEAHFTQDEIKLLNLYFKDGSIQENTFVLSDVNYKAEDIPLTMVEVSLHISGTSIVEVPLSEQLSKRLFDFRGGLLSLSKKDFALSGNIVNVTFEYNTSTKAFLLSCFLRDVTHQENAYPSANLSLKGNLSDFTSTSETLHFQVVSSTSFLQFGVTEYAQQIVEKELYDYAVDALEKLAFPSYEFHIESANFLFIKEFQPFKDALTLGNSISLMLNDDTVIHPLLIEVNLDYESFDNYSMTFSNKFTKSDGASHLVDLIGKSVTTANSVDFNKFNYSAYKNSGANTAVKDYISSGLDVAKNGILNSGEQAISWDTGGIHLRKWTDGKTDYLPEQIRMINNMIGFTDDGWKTAKIAIGKFADKNLGNCWGIIAPNITGTLLAGENLVIENLSPDGKNMQFKVDSSGAYLNNSQFLIQSNNGGQVALDPAFGLAIGGSLLKPLYTVDGNGKLSLNKANANFFTDTDGSLTLKGSVYAEKGIFKGTIQANQYLNASGKDMFLNGKFQSNYLDLGNIKLDGTTGDITMSGNINLSAGNINWGNSSPVKYQFSVSGSNWHDTMTSTDKYRRDSLDGGITWGASYQFRGSDGVDGSDGSDASVPGYIKNTYIDFTGIASPMIVTNLLELQSPDSNSSKSGLLLSGYYGGSKKKMFEISYFEGDAAWVNFTSPANAYASWDFGKTNFSGYIDFSGATVTGLKTIATFA